MLLKQKMLVASISNPYAVTLLVLIAHSFYFSFSLPNHIFNNAGAGSTALHYAACGGNAQCCQV